ncbi:hypothetical protein Taro_013148 [Colocasia esculenta]|uniref:Uncharacterized protein n=1 Tax=Colocasia esculenta TaxID=4460 RepID=A0A843UFP3_COLES|nr:hypothetical protein [Colocasia esculenta]
MLFRTADFCKICTSFYTHHMLIIVVWLSVWNRYYFLLLAYYNLMLARNNIHRITSKKSPKINYLSVFERVWAVLPVLFMMNRSGCTRMAEERFLLICSAENMTWDCPAKSSFCKH